MNVAKDWGAEQSQWLADLSFGIAVGASIALAAGLLWLFRIPLLWLLMTPFRRVLRFTFAWLGVLVSYTPLRHPLRRYLYVGQHLAEA
jgi:hypothetical protein